MNKKIMMVAAAIVALTLQAATPASAATTRARGAGELRDLQLTTDQPTDHATAQVVAYESDGWTTVVLKVQGLDHAAAGITLGAHVHIGSCVTGDGAAALGHYRNGAPPATAANEVWLDFVVQENGTGWAEATVHFVIPEGGAGAVVIHRDQTSTGTPPPPGSAGPRWACLPVQF